MPSTTLNPERKYSNEEGYEYAEAEDLLDSARHASTTKPANGHSRQVSTILSSNTIRDYKVEKTFSIARTNSCSIVVNACLNEHWKFIRI